MCKDSATGKLVPNDFFVTHSVMLTVEDQPGSDYNDCIVKILTV